MIKIKNNDFYHVFLKLLNLTLLKIILNLNIKGMKIKKIEVKNLKAIAAENIDLNGCSAIITAGNNKGKSTLLKSLIDRFRGEIPDKIVKQGEENGFSVMELTDGSKIEWKFTEKGESFSFTTKEGIKQTSGVLKAIGEKYFGRRFDIDSFLNSTPKSQKAELQRLIGLDFTEIDNKYKISFDNRTNANRDLKNHIAKNIIKPEKIDKPEIESIESEIAKIKSKNELILIDWRQKNQNNLKAIQDFNLKQSEIKSKKDISIDCMVQLKEIGFESNELNIFVESFKPEPLKELKNLPDPEIENTDELTEKLRLANNQLRVYDSYCNQLEMYDRWVYEGKNLREIANKYDNEVKEIESQKLEMLKAAKIPAEFKITEDGILYNNLPLTNAQISSSSKYIAALKLGFLALGEIKTMHFDASFLDKNSLSEIEKWANENNLQLLIERPDFDGGDIKYDLINNC